MVTPVEVENQELYDKIKVMSNKLRFKILELTKKEERSVTELAKELGLSYSKCGDYIRLLEAEGLVMKRKEGKEVFIRSNINQVFAHLGNF